MNAIRGLGEGVLDEVIIKKVLRSLKTKYGTKFSPIEEDKDLKTFSMDELFGSLLASEKITINGETSKREVALNITKKGKEVDTSAKEDGSDTAKAKFVRKLKKGSSKYKGKHPFKCFNCGKIGHFAAKYPYEEKGEDEKHNVKIFGKENVKKSYNPKRRNFRRKNNLYTLKSDATDEESVSDENYSEDEKEVNLFMGQEELDEGHTSRIYCRTQTRNQSSLNSNEKDEVEAEVDLEGELICALKEI
ncbi:uncharacterized protein LOC131032184 [Cryptomeria japonica]|uniref:uncharacterized protein LOC131032184 n=1 Tax=Cryptomeria japonica TaxID=3369 RepID=UPI0025AD2D37|nr:uncharacterized protein LOC131032184 [Cryptomeria japonica]